MKESGKGGLPAHLGLVEWFRPGEYDRVRRVVEYLRRLGIRRLRTGISWADWYTSAGAQWYDWLFPYLAAEVELLPCFLYTPPSMGVAPKTSAPPVKGKDYADFLDVCITRYGDHFDYVELWNEPNNLSEWDWTLDPHWSRFGEMIGGAAYWARQRGKKTVLGGMSPIDGHWLCRIFEMGVMPYIDVVGIHGFPDIFDYNWKGWPANIAQVQEVLREKGSGCAIWITEAGFSTWQHDEQQQLRVFLELLEVTVERAYWYGVDDLAPGLAAVDRFHLDEREYSFGFTRADGSEKLLCRLLEGGGVPAVRRVAEIGPPPGPRAEEKGVLITGGAGFIGTNLAGRLLEEGERVILYDNLSRPGVEGNLAFLKDRYGSSLDVRIADIRNTTQLERAVAEAKHVFHFAAQVAVTTSLEQPAHDFAVNGAGTFALLDAVRKAPSPPSLLFTSTNKVYGALGDVPLERSHGRYQPVEGALRGNGFSEGIPLDFLSPYGCSKGCADQYVLDFARSFGIDAAVFRMSCIYGPHQCGNEDQGWVAHFVLSVLLNAPITLYGDGCQVRDLLFVEDLVDAFLRARGMMPKLAGTPFNIGGGPERAASLLELLEILRTLHGGLPQIAFGDWRTGDQRYYVSDTRRFREATGWAPRHSVEQGVAKLYQWLAEALHVRGRKGADAYLEGVYPSTGVTR